jgi:tetratricopeptide (TPR) repeat protein
MKRILVLALVIALGGVAVADNKEKADVLFKQGKKLMGEKRYADACQAFEESFKLDPGIGGELNIARCYEEWGKLARAYRSYSKAEDMARDAKDPREAKIHELVATIDKQVPRLTIKLPAGLAPESVQVTIDGAPVDAKDLGKPQIVDPGPRLVEYQSDGTKKNKVVLTERGGESTLTLDVAPAVTHDDHGHDHDHDHEDHGTTPPPVDPGRNQKLIAYGTAGAGGVLIAISSYMALSARSKYNDALSAHCMGKTNMCDPQGLSATHDARHEANIATVLFLLGGAAVGGGVALYLLAPHAPRSGDEHALYFTPEARGDGAGLVFGGRF